MNAVDGNAIAGRLEEAFGRDMTAATGTCARCGAAGPLAEVEAYVRAPGVVARCRSCHAVLIVLVEVRGMTCVDLAGLAALAGPRTEGPAAPLA